MKYDMWHLTGDMWHVTRDMSHMVGGENSLKISAPQLLRCGIHSVWTNEDQWPMWTNERPGTDHVTSGPIRGLKKTATDGADIQTSRQTNMETTKSHQGSSHCFQRRVWSLPRDFLGQTLSNKTKVLQLRVCLRNIFIETSHCPKGSS